jgi:hypothetical protein
MEAINVTLKSAMTFLRSKRGYGMGCQFRKILGAATAGILCVTPVVSAGDDTWEPSNYEQRFEVPRNGVRLQDNNVWVYKREFADRFGMPERWIDDDLEGAEAVAYRIETQNIRSCGFFGEPENCRSDYYCTFDVYMSDSESEKLPWKSDRVTEFSKVDSSWPFLTPQSRRDQIGWIEGEQRIDRSQLNIGLDSLSWVSGPPRDDKVYSGSSSGVRVMAYDREIFEGLDYIRLSSDCSIARREHNVRIFFTEQFPVRTDYGVDYRELVAETTQEARNFKRIKQKWTRDFKTGNVPHVVGLPDRYMARVNEYDRTVYVPRSLATEVGRRVRGQDSNEENKGWWQKLFGAGE